MINFNRSLSLYCPFKMFMFNNIARVSLLKNVSYKYGAATLFSFEMISIQILLFLFSFLPTGHNNSNIVSTPAAAHRCFLFANLTNTDSEKC